jgi:hypothetical protein
MDREWSYADSGAHPRRGEAKWDWCGKTKRRMTQKQCLINEEEGNEEWSCKAVRKFCGDAGWTKAGLVNKEKEVVSAEADVAASKLAAETVKGALAPTDASPTAGGAMGAEAPQSGSNTMLYVGAGVGLLVVAGLAFFLLKPSGAPASAK